MLKRYHQTTGFVYRAADACVIGGIWLLSYWMRFALPFIEVTKGFPSFETYAALLPLVLFLWFTIFTLTGAYSGERMLRRTHEVQIVLKSHGIALLLFIALTYLVSDYKYSRGVMLYFGITGALCLVGARLLIRNTLRALKKGGYKVRKALAIGEGPTLNQVCERLGRFPELGLQITGVLTKDGTLSPPHPRIPCLGRYEDLAQVLASHPVQEIVVTLPRTEAQAMDPILRSVHQDTIDISVFPDIHAYSTLGCEIEDFNGLPVVHINSSSLGGPAAVLKRALDVLLSAALLILLSPLFLIIAALLALTSPGPVIFVQERMGLDGKTFRMLKFRTMKADAEDKSGPVWAKKNDDRRTFLGKFLRSSSIDEFPQLWNVLKGEMSLVGPRPERPIFVQKFRHEIPDYMLRHKVKAGMTGWAQVNGYRGDTSLEKRIEHDLFYIRNWSIMMDFRILCLTILRGFIHKHAH